MEKNKDHYEKKIKLLQNKISDLMEDLIDKEFKISNLEMLLKLEEDFKKFLKESGEFWKELNLKLVSSLVEESKTNHKLATNIEQLQKRINELENSNDLDSITGNKNDTDTISNNNIDCRNLNQEIIDLLLEVNLFPLQTNENNVDSNTD